MSNKDIARGLYLLGMQAFLAEHGDTRGRPEGVSPFHLTFVGTRQIEAIAGELHKLCPDLGGSSPPSISRLAEVDFSLASDETLGRAIKALTFASWVLSEESAVQFIRKLTLAALVEAAARLKGE